MQEVLIISPDSPLLSALENTLRQVKTMGRALALRQYPSKDQVLALLASHRVSTVIVGLSEPEAAVQVIRELSSANPRPAIIAAHTENSADLILGAIRAGASQYIGPPFQPEHLESILSLRPDDEADPECLGKVIAVLPARGGCGASTVALHTAAAMGALGQKVLLVDFDFHSGSTAFQLKLKPAFTLADALERSGCLDELWPRLAHPWGGIHILAPPPDFRLSEEELSLFPSVFASARSKYDCVVVDLPPAVYSSCRDVLMNADKIYIVCTPELISLHCARRRVEQLAQLGVAKESVGLVLNRTTRREQLSVAEVSNAVGVPVSHTLSNAYEAVNRASWKASLVPGSSELGKQFAALARQIVGAPASTARRSRWKDLLRRRRALELPPPEEVSPPGTALDISPVR